MSRSTNSKRRPAPEQTRSRSSSSERYVGSPLSSSGEDSKRSAHQGYRGVWDKKQQMQPTALPVSTETRDQHCQIIGTWVPSYVNPFFMQPCTLAWIADLFTNNENTWHWDSDHEEWFMQRQSGYFRIAYRMIGGWWTATLAKWDEVNMETTPTTAADRPLATHTEVPFPVTASPPHGQLGQPIA